MTDTQRMVEAKRKIEEAMAYGEKAGLDWLRSAFLTHESQIGHLLEEFHELRLRFLQAVHRPLTVREAQLLRVCRICRGPNTPKEAGDSFLLRFGDEHAHESCVALEQRGVATTNA